MIRKWNIMDMSIVQMNTHALLGIDVRMGGLASNRHFFSFSKANQFFYELSESGVPVGSSECVDCRIVWEDRMEYNVVVEISHTIDQERFLERAIQQDIHIKLFGTNISHSQEELEQLLISPYWQMDRLFYDAEANSHLTKILLTAAGLSAPAYIASKVRFGYAFRNVRKTFPGIRRTFRKAFEFLSFVRGLQSFTEKQKQDILQRGKWFFLAAIKASIQKDSAQTKRALAKADAFLAGYACDLPLARETSRSRSQFRV